MSESKLQDKCMKWVRKEFPDAFHVKLSDRFNSGILDTLHVIDGTVYFIELKVPGKKPSKLQAHTIKVLNENGGKWVGSDPPRQLKTVVATWVDNFEDFKTVFERSI